MKKAHMISVIWAFLLILHFGAKFAIGAAKYRSGVIFSNYRLWAIKTAFDF